MSDLLILVHADPSVLPSYRAALAPLSSDWTVVTKTVGALSRAYQQYAGILRRRGGLLLDALLEDIGHGPRARWDRIVLASYSAGYALVREVLSGPDAEFVAGWIGIDSGHAGFDADGTAADAQMAPFVALARRAAAGQALLWYGHTDVRTPQAGAGAFASTTQFADELLHLLGACATPPPTRYVSPTLVLRAYDLEHRDHDEHVAALLRWGPGFVGAALAALDGVDHDGPHTPAPPTPGLQRLRQRFLDVAIGEFGEHEQPRGSNDGPAVRRYFAGTGIKPPAHWCGAFLLWCLGEAARRCGVRLPMAGVLRGSVRAKDWMRQAQDADQWVSAADARANPALVAPGDVPVWHRGAPGAPTGHVGMVVAVDAAAWTFSTVEGNSGPAGDSVARMARRFDDPLLLGFARVVNVGQRPATRD